MQHSTLTIRTATLKDVPEIVEALKIMHPAMQPCFTEKEIKSHIKSFPEGQFLAQKDSKIIGYCPSIRISKDKALQPHTRDEICGKGLVTTHDPKGDYLYGLECTVDSEYKKLGIGKRFYDKRKRLCARLQLSGIVIGTCLQQFSENQDNIKKPEDYLKLVLTKKINDERLYFQFHSGFEAIMILKNYLPEDKDSEGYAALMVWYNPEVILFQKPKPIAQFEGTRRLHIVTDFIRVVGVQFGQYKIKDFDEFERHVEYYVQAASDYRADFLLFPELFTMQLITITSEVLSEIQAIVHLASFTDDFKSMMKKFAVQYNVNIIGGSQPTIVNGVVENIAYIFLRDGTIHAQSKIHPTPTEKDWGMSGGHEANAIMTDRGLIGVLICYDSEFPELIRHLVDQGIHMLFVPFCTDERRGYLRVRYCNQARAVENQVYVAIAGNVGNLPGSHNMNINYAQSCIMTPCDYPFSWDGIAADTTPNVEGMMIADLNIRALISTRNAGGTVMNLKDRRHDLYTIAWHPPK